MMIFKVNVINKSFGMNILFDALFNDYLQKQRKENLKSILN